MFNWIKGWWYQHCCRHQWLIAAYEEDSLERFDVCLLCDKRRPSKRSL